MKKRLKLSSVLGSVLLSAALLTSAAFANEQLTEISITAEDSASVTDSELLMGYFKQQYERASVREKDGIIITENVMYSALAPDKLNAAELKVYNGCKTGIEKIAAGEEISSEIPVGTVEFTYAQLGLQPSAEYSDVQAAVNSLYNKVYQYLLYDLPYDFYWHDKTKGITGGYAITQGDTVTVSNMVFRIAPSVEYAGSGEYVVDTAKTSAASKAAINAKTIIEENKDKTDIEKLTAYKEAICELVTYDSAAADSSPSVVGIDPWQLIHVFDGDENTNVVCEGYSKAFMYLCELTDFSGYIDCHCASGKMNGGAHMWNIVTIGSRNYLADVTNCDNGTIGYPDELFLKGVFGSVSNGYTATVGSTEIEYIYRDTVISLFGQSLLALSSLDYSAEIDDSADYEPPVSEDSGIVVWANGGKEYKSKTILSTLKATDWQNTKGKTQKGKLLWIVTTKDEAPVFDTEKHKITTKSDKTYASVSKGKVTAKSGGENGETVIYVYASDNGTMKNEGFAVTVKNAASSLLLFDDAEKTDKKEAIKKINLIAGGDSARIYVTPSAKQGKVSADCTYSISSNKNEDGVISLTGLKTDENGRMYFEVSGVKTIKEGKTSKITVTVSCDQSGKKANLSVNIGSPVDKITASGEGKVATKGDAVALKLAVSVKGKGTATTDKLQLVVCASAPVIDENKVTAVKSKEISAKLEKDGKTVTVKASKDITSPQGVYVIVTDSLTKAKNCIKIADIAADGTVTVV
ncbi:MAG: hypothetical protein IJ416_00035 [Ruminiclostridium sp.]|nr:hypothetical protein [Ruminiclostridium sp.]